MTILINFFCMQIASERAGRFRDRIIGIIATFF